MRHSTFSDHKRYLSLLPPPSSSSSSSVCLSLSISLSHSCSEFVLSALLVLTKRLVRRSRYTLDRGMAFGESRKYHDLFFAGLYVVVYAAAAILTFSTAVPQADYDLVPPVELGCPAATTDGTASGHGMLHASLSAVGVQSFESFLEAFRQKILWVLPVVVGSACLIGVVYLQLLRCFARPMVYISLGFFPAGFIGAGVAVASVPEDAVGGMDPEARRTTMLVLFGLAALYLLILCCLRKRIEMTARTLTTAGEALSNTAAVFVTCFVVFLTWVALSSAMSVGMVVAFFNGEWEAIADPEAPGEVESCIYKLNDVGAATLAGCAFVFLWTSLLFTELRGFVRTHTLPSVSST
jgi:hypothetical protein